MEGVEWEAEALRSRADKQLANAQLREEASMLSVYGWPGGCRCCHGDSYADKLQATILTSQALNQETTELTRFDLKC